MRTALLAVLLALGLAAPSSAAVIQTYKGAPGPGPAKYDKVLVEQFGPASARTVLVLVPGTQGGAGDYAMLGPEIAGRVGDLQVWAMDRRSYQLEDTTGFDTGDADEAFRYYLGGGGFAPPTDADTPWARKWGLKLALEDLRRVVKQAGKGGRRVILGGHSLGASEAVAYAAWDFKGRPGFRDLSGLVLIDGGLLGTLAPPKLADVKQRVADLRKGDPFLDLLGIGVPWASGVFSDLAGLYAKARPDARATFVDYPLIPAALKPPVPSTNEGALGYAFDESTSPAVLSLIHVRAGALATSGDPRPWQNGEVSPIENVAKLFGRSPVDASEWYFPKRLSLDVQAAGPLSRSAAANYLHLREWHRRGIDVPLYAIQTSLSRGRVLRGARRLVAASRIPVTFSNCAEFWIGPICVLGSSPSPTTVILASRPSSSQTAS